MKLLRSWVDSANAAATDFPLNNLPCGVFSIGDEAGRCGVAIGDFILDISALEAEGLLKLADQPLFDVPFWNEFMEAGPAVWAEFRAQVTAMLREGASKRWVIEDHLVPIADAVLHLPFIVAEYTDFYAGRHHAENVAALLQTEMPPAWPHMPLGYNGRASSVVVSGSAVRRPWGQLKGAGFEAPIFAPSRRFDFELELGAIVGQASAHGYPVTVAEADVMIFGYVLLNDWSARDIQAWESQPLGPFQGKATATSLSPWIVMKAALQPFRIATQPRAVALLPHLAEPGPLLYTIELEVALTPQNGVETVISRTNAAALSYAAAQQLAHHTTSGCAMNVGDLLGSGTISGATADSWGSLLELSHGGKAPVAIAGGARRFLEDGDTISLRGAASGDGYRIGFGACSGTVGAALADPYARD
ncbi:fumarylacetoacetase [Cypionkella aquatica]|uniref:fumarylacetoacetase n=1 Tax=Cypionkella aquatica TaxID=1756042 RepID=A0AA37U1Y0_9RHOB|nr:fumarylacetoacetase [Cypionkella aquatica]GLS86005.1 fumarylacetoacetase [Cypionkella aquatica]